ncbi:MAG: FHA domain-containing protein [Myxococcota bacterium]
MPQFATETRVISQASVRPPEEQVAASLVTGTPLPKNTRIFFDITASPGRRGLYTMTKPIVILGRAEGVADIFVDDDAASRYHASVSYTDRRFVLTDMGSTNGTLVNRASASEVELHSGDEIRIGQTVIIFGVIASEHNL